MGRQLEPGGRLRVLLHLQRRRDLQRAGRRLRHPTDGADPDLPATRPNPATFCNQVGSCPAPLSPAASGGTTRWYCQYPAATVDAGGNIVPETRCNLLDEDSRRHDRRNRPGVRHSAADLADPRSAGIGACLQNGTYRCTVTDSGRNARSPAARPAPRPATAWTTTATARPTILETDFAAWGAVQVSGSVDTNRPRDGTRETARAFYVMPGKHRAPTRPQLRRLAQQPEGLLQDRRAALDHRVLTDAQAACCRLNTLGTCRTSGGFPGLVPLPQLRLGAFPANDTTGYYTYPYGNTYQAATCNGNDYDTRRRGRRPGRHPRHRRNAELPEHPSFPPSASWIYDASGNVKEWT